MVSIFSWIKKEIAYLFKSLPDIFRGLLIFILAFSGIACALLMRHLEFSGTFITTISLIIEGISLLLCYFLFKGRLKSEEEIESMPT